MNIYEKLGDFFLNMVNLTIGGVIFAAVMANDDINPTVLYVVSVCLVVAMFIIAIMLLKISKKSNVMLLIMFLSTIGAIIAIGGSIVAYRNKSILFPKHYKRHAV
jgi:ABC-type transport system involved in multi-copper enzyme maturation permease subunit